MRLAHKIAVIALVCGTAFAQKPGEWMLDEAKDAMTSKAVKTSWIISNNSLSLGFPYQGRNHGQIIVRNKGGRTTVMVSVEKGQIQCNDYSGCDVMVRFDDAPPQRFSGTESADNDSKVFFLNNEPRFIAAARKAKRILIRFTMYQQGQQTLEFSSNQPLTWAGMK